MAQIRANCQYLYKEFNISKEIPKDPPIRSKTWVFCNSDQKTSSFKDQEHTGSKWSSSRSNFFGQQEKKPDSQLRTEFFNAYKKYYRRVDMKKLEVQTCFNIDTAHEDQGIEGNSSLYKEKDCMEINILLDTEKDDPVVRKQIRRTIECSPSERSSKEKETIEDFQDVVPPIVKNGEFERSKEVEIFNGSNIENELEKTKEMAIPKYPSKKYITPSSNQRNKRLQPRLNVMVLNGNKGEDERILETSKPINKLFSKEQFSKPATNECFNVTDSESSVSLEISERKYADVWGPSVSTLEKNHKTTRCDRYHHGNQKAIGPTTTKKRYFNCGSRVGNKNFYHSNSSYMAQVNQNDKTSVTHSTQVNNLSPNITIKRRQEKTFEKTNKTGEDNKNFTNSNTTNLPIRNEKNQLDKNYPEERTQVLCRQSIPNEILGTHSDFKIENESPSCFTTVNSNMEREGTSCGSNTTNPMSLSNRQSNKICCKNTENPDQTSTKPCCNLDKQTSNEIDSRSTILSLNDEKILTEHTQYFIKNVLIPEISKSLRLFNTLEYNIKNEEPSSKNQMEMTSDSCSIQQSYNSSGDISENKLNNQPEDLSGSEMLGTYSDERNERCYDEPKSNMKNDINRNLNMLNDFNYVNEKYEDNNERYVKSNCSERKEYPRSFERNFFNPYRNYGGISTKNLNQRCMFNNHNEEQYQKNKIQNTNKKSKSQLEKSLNGNGKLRYNIDTSGNINKKSEYCNRRNNYNYNNSYNDQYKKRSVFTNKKSPEMDNKVLRWSKLHSYQIGPSIFQNDTPPRAVRNEDYEKSETSWNEPNERYSRTCFNECCQRSGLHYKCHDEDLSPGGRNVQKYHRECCNNKTCHCEKILCSLIAKGVSYKKDGLNCSHNNSSKCSGHCCNLGKNHNRHCCLVDYFSNREFQLNKTGSLKTECNHSNVNRNESREISFPGSCFIDNFPQEECVYDNRRGVYQTTRNGGLENRCDGSEYPTNVDNIINTQEHTRTILIENEEALDSALDQNYENLRCDSSNNKAQNVDEYHSYDCHKKYEINTNENRNPISENNCYQPNYNKKYYPVEARDNFRMIKDMTTVPKYNIRSHQKQNNTWKDERPTGNFFNSKGDSINFCRGGYKNWNNGRSLRNDIRSRNNFSTVKVRHEFHFEDEERWDDEEDNRTKRSDVDNSVTNNQPSYLVDEQWDIHHEGNVGNSNRQHFSRNKPYNYNRFNNSTNDKRRTMPTRREERWDNDIHERFPSGHDRSDSEEENRNRQPKNSFPRKKGRKRRFDPRRWDMVTDNVPKNQYTGRQYRPREEEDMSSFEDSGFDGTLVFNNRSYDD